MDDLGECSPCRTCAHCGEAMEQLGLDTTPDGEAVLVYQCINNFCRHQYALPLEVDIDGEIRIFRPKSD